MESTSLAAFVVVVTARARGADGGPTANFRDARRRRGKRNGEAVAYCVSPPAPGRRHTPAPPPPPPARPRRPPAPLPRPAAPRRPEPSPRRLAPRPPRPDPTDRLPAPSAAA